MHSMIGNHAASRVLRTVLLGLSLIPCHTFSVGTAVALAASPASQPGFLTPEDAVAALIKAVQADDVTSIIAILGPHSERLVASGDPTADRNSRKNFLASYDAQHALEAKGPDAKVLTVGTDGWPLPFPIVHAGDVWRFDAHAGAEEIIDRRIGRNEFATIRTLLSFVEAEQDYFDRAKRGVGTGFYAQRVLSTPGTFDGLYWGSTDGDPPSPLDPLVQQARGEGYPGEATPDGKPVPYHGYLFRVLRAQGPAAEGGAKDYVRNGQMTEGFGFVAWPAQYGNSGIVTFIVDRDGTVFQKDLGPTTAKTVAGVTRFDPDPTWARVDIKDEQ